MSLSALTDLFARHRARATGLWRLGQDPHRTIFMEAGDIVFATSTHPLMTTVPIVSVILRRARFFGAS